MHHDLKRELLAIAAGGGVLLLLIIPAFLFARTSARDDLRIQDITNLKRALEIYNNDKNYYPTPPQSQPPCTDSYNDSSWFFGTLSPLLRGQYADVIPHDVRESENQNYRYCVTETSSAGKAVGYFLEAQLEIHRSDTIGFDEDEDRKFDYRTLNENGQTLYRVCGGTELQCKEVNENL